MTNKCKKIKKNTKHYFVLGGREELYFREEIAVVFKPYNKTKNRTRTSITPTFNNDRKHFTYSFTLPSVPSEKDEHLEVDHKKRVAEALLEIEDILMPKPRSKHKYCGVCRGHYQDYKEHTEGPDHISFLKRSIYQSMIVELCKQVQRTNFQREQKEQDESKAIDLTSEENPPKLMTDCSQISTPLKPSSIRSQ